MKSLRIALFVLPLLVACDTVAPPPTAIAPTPSALPPAVTLVATSGAAPPVVAEVMRAAVATDAPQLVATPASTDTPAPVAAPAATATPAGPVFVQLTQGGCCVQPFFAPDGGRVLFLDRPSGVSPIGYYGVPVDQPLSEPQLAVDRLGPFDRNLTHRSMLLNGQTLVERIADGQRWTINNGGRSVSFSPDATRIVWSVSSEAGGFDVRRSDVFIANVDGSDAKKIITRYGGGPVAWLNDGARMLIGGRPNPRDKNPTLGVLDLATGEVRDLVTAERWRGVVLAPDNKHVVYFVAQARGENLGGTFLLNLDNPQPIKLDFFGGYRWRDATRLLYVPLSTAGTPSNELWQFDVTTMTSTKLIDGSVVSPFKIGNGDWDVSPDGSLLTWLNARDRNIWIARLTP